MPLHQQSKTNQNIDSQTEEKSIRHLLEDFKASMKRAFHEEDKIDQFCSTRGLPPAVLKELMSENPLALCIPKEYGGFGGSVRDNIAFVSAASYESLALSLTLGINNALFIQPVSKYGQESAKPKVFNQFLNHSCMGGLMITEPDFGSDALSMHTSFTQKEGYFHIRGKKHWAGLTGMADFWLLTARKRTDTDSLMRDIDMFICDVNAPRQNIVVEEYFENLGLYQIPYGRNHIDVYIPEEQRLIPRTNGIQMLLDLLHRSRFQFPGMGLGFIKRILDEAIAYKIARCWQQTSVRLRPGPTPAHKVTGQFHNLLSFLPEVGRDCRHRKRFVVTRPRSEYHQKCYFRYDAGIGTVAAATRRCQRI